MINKKRECLRCKQEMIEVKPVSGRYKIFLLKSPEKFFGKNSSTAALVCPSSAYVEWVA